jgi:thiopeptide-type bacteriocin biosynthesis protein
MRLPSYPIEAYQTLHGTPPASGGLHAADPRVRLIVATASLSLLDALDRPLTSPKDQAHREDKLLRYLIRMATRPTPFGLFAGVALGTWAETTDLSLATAAPLTQSRPDMSWLLRLVWTLEEMPEVRRCLRYVTNTALFIQGGRGYLHEKVRHKQAQPTDIISLRATGVVRQALRLARQPIAHIDLVEALLEARPGATEAQVEGLVTELWRHKALWTDLRPPLTIANPARYVFERLASIAPARPVYEYLGQVIQNIAAWDALAGAQEAPDYRRLIHLLQQSETILASFPLQAEQALSTSAPAPLAGDNQPKTKQQHHPSGAPLQVDMALPLAGQSLSREVGKEVARAAELLLRISSFPHGSPILADYRKQFIDHYGEERDVPLLEALDPNFGLGLPRGYSDPQASAKTLDSAHQERDQTLLELALHAWRKRETIVELDEALVKRLETSTPPPEMVPASWDVYALIAASSASAIDAGQFQVVLGPALAARPARSSLGRFAHLLGERASALLQGTALQQEQRGPGHLWADLVFLPMRDRSANVAIFPASRPYQILYGASAENASIQTIPPDELLLSVRHDRFMLRWARSSAEVIVCSGNMLNPELAPGLMRFLSQISWDAMPIITPFSWGPAELFPFLPRVQMGRIVLSLARWNLNAPAIRQDLFPETPESFQRSAYALREQWDVPRYVYLAQQDNRLLLDLECPQQREVLRTELRGGTDRQVLVQEGLPSPDQAWVEGPGGHYMLELVVSLMQRKQNVVPATPETGQTAPRPASAAAEKTESLSALRLRSPGSDWLFLKLYAGFDLHEGLLTGPIRSLVKEVFARHLADNWFFIRYQDPDPHIRLRFHGDPEVLTSQLLPALSAWSNKLVRDSSCLKVTFDTYDREIERYGGLAGIELAEALFGADSRAAADLIALTQAHTLELERRLLAVLSIDGLLAGLGASAQVRLDWYRQRVTQRYQTGQIYRNHSAQLRALLGTPTQALAALPGGAEAAAILAARRATLEPVAARLSELATMQGLTRPLTALYASYSHMHCNRLIGIDHQTEEEVMGLLLRTQESLMRAPVV